MSAIEYLRSIDSPLTVRAVAEIEGMSREHLSRMWQTDRARFKQIVARVHDKIK
jgi:hypothetical protein